MTPEQQARAWWDGFDVFASKEDIVASLAALLRATESATRAAVVGECADVAWKYVDRPLRFGSGIDAETAATDTGAAIEEMIRTLAPGDYVGVRRDVLAKVMEAAQRADSMLRTVSECTSHGCVDCREASAATLLVVRAALDELRAVAS